MVAQIAGPLDEMSDDELYRLLGEGWIANLKFKGGESYYFGPALEMGKREFGTIEPMLRHDRHRNSTRTLETSVFATIRDYASWQMPAAIVLALAKRAGIDQVPVSPASHV
jgi:hypothetical protein